MPTTQSCDSENNTRRERASDGRVYDRNRNQVIYSKHPLMQHFLDSIQSLLLRRLSGSVFMEFHDLSHQTSRSWSCVKASDTYMELLMLVATIMKLRETAQGNVLFGCEFHGPCLMKSPQVGNASRSLPLDGKGRKHTHVLTGQCCRETSFLWQIRPFTVAGSSGTSLRPSL